MVAGWVLISPGKWMRRAGGLRGAMVVVGTCMIAFGMVTVVQARN